MLNVLNLTERACHAHAGVALTIGNFDGVHRGHQAMLARLKEAAAHRGLPAAVMTFEPHPREFFTPTQAPARLTSLREKLELMQALGVDLVYLCRFGSRFAALTAEEFIARILLDTVRAKWVLVGDDFRFGARRAGDFTLLARAGRQYGFEAETLPSVLVDGTRVSSTAVREALAAGDMAWAARLLGRPYSISGRVVHGDKLGVQLGFPTANIQMKHNRPPLSGIFAVELCGLDGAISGQCLPGVASLGVRPTVKENGVPTLEVHVFDFHERLYGAHVRVNFLHKLRDEEKYPTLEALIAQIERDVAEARRFFDARAQRGPSHQG
ncbi:bifunctional riboflavin kinase/FAD synthetase [Thiobacter aerophilum]|uniref:Riboflavin biosynthesis protein n=1 Tax=Thiobacter aerophilum TaxID=3121275 RepID=A0ABV0EH90_9BURK